MRVTSGILEDRLSNGIEKPSRRNSSFRRSANRESIIWSAQSWPTESSVYLNEGTYLTFLKTNFRVLPSESVINTGMSPM